MKSNKFWIIIIGAILALSAAAAALFYLTARPGNIAVVSQNGKELYRLDLAEDASITVEADDGGYNVITVSDGKISVTEADCPDQICVKQGAICTDETPIVCLPHGLVIEVSAKSDIDAVG